METELVRDLKDDTDGRVVRDMMGLIKERLVKINNYTSFNSIRSFTPAEVEILVSHLEKCHKLIWELSELMDYELPYKCPKLIYAARELRKSVS